MTTRFLGAITPPNPTVAVTPGGGGISNAGTFYFFLVTRCVAGFTKTSASTAITVAVNDRIDITIPSGVRTAGSDVREIHLLVNTIDDSGTASIVASYPGYALSPTASTPTDYSETETILPADIQIQTDVQLEQGTVLSQLADLPSGGDLLNGMPRLVDGDGGGLIYTYNAQFDDWFPLFPQTFNPDVGNTTDPAQLGCDRPIRAIPESSTEDIIYPVYGAEGVSRAVPVLLVNNFNSTNINQGKAIELAVGNDNESFLRFATITPRGIVNLTTGTLDTSDQDLIGGSFPADRESSIAVTLEKDLEPGNGFWIDIRLNFSIEDLGNSLLEGSFITFYADFSPFNSKQTPDAGLFGDIIGPIADYGRIIPNGPSIFPLVTSRTGKVRGYTFPSTGGLLGESLVAEVLTNTADQNIIITNDGTAFRADTTPPTASLRAIISTVDGVGPATDFSGSFNVDSSTLLDVTLTNPTTIRPTYPDILGIQQQAAVLNATSIRVYTRPTGGGSIDYFDIPITGAVSEQIDVGNTGATNIASLPTVDADYGLFQVENVVITTKAGPSNFPAVAVDIEVAVAYVYNNTVTKISHDPLVLEAEAIAQGDATRYIREASSSIWALFALVDTIGFPLETVADAQALTAEELAVYKMFFLAETESIYYWNATDTRPEDGDSIIAVSGITTGRLISISSKGAVTEYVTADITLDNAIPKDYFVDASAGPIVLTVDVASNSAETAKHNIFRLDDTGNSVTLVCSGSDVFNRSRRGTASISVYRGETVEIAPDKSPTDIGHSVQIKSPRSLEFRRERIIDDVEFYVDPSGDNTDGRTLATAFTSLHDLAERINGIDAGVQLIEVYLTAGATIPVRNANDSVPLEGYTSLPGRGAGIFFYGDFTTRPQLDYTFGSNSISFAGNLEISFFAINFINCDTSTFFLSRGAAEFVFCDVALTGTSQTVFQSFGEDADMSVLSTVVTSTNAIAQFGSVQTGGSFEIGSGCDVSGIAGIGAEFIFGRNAKTIEVSSSLVTGALAGGRQFDLQRGSTLYAFGGTLPGSLPGILDANSFFDGYGERYRIKLTANIILYVSTAGNDDNTGQDLSAGFAKRTLEGAFDELARYDLNGNQASISLLPGSYNYPASLKMPAGIEDVGDITVQSNTTAVRFLDPVTCSGLDRFTFDNVIFDNVLNIQQGAFIRAINTEFEVNDERCFVVESGARLIVGDTIIDRTAPISFIDVRSGGLAVVEEGSFLDFIGSPSFSDAYLVVGEGGILKYPRILSSGGSQSGVRFRVFSGGQIITADEALEIPGSLTSIPGSLPGQLYRDGKIDVLPDNHFLANDLGTYSASQTVDWDLQNGEGIPFATLEISNGATITLTVSNVSINGNYVLEGILGIDTTVPGTNLVLPANWTLTPGSDDPNAALGVNAAFKFKAEGLTNLSPAVLVEFTRYI